MSKTRLHFYPPISSRRILEDIHSNAIGIHLGVTEYSLMVVIGLTIVASASDIAMFQSLEVTIVLLSANSELSSTNQ